MIRWPKVMQFIHYGNRLNWSLLRVFLKLRSIAHGAFASCFQAFRLLAFVEQSVGRTVQVFQVQARVDAHRSQWPKIRKSHNKLIWFLNNKMSHTRLFISSWTSGHCCSSSLRMRFVCNGVCGTFVYWAIQVFFMTSSMVSRFFGSTQSIPFISSFASVVTFVHSGEGKSYWPVLILVFIPGEMAKPWLL